MSGLSRIASSSASNYSANLHGIGVQNDMPISKITKTAFIISGRYSFDILYDSIEYLLCLKRKAHCVWFVAEGPGSCKCHWMSSRAYCALTAGHPGKRYLRTTGNEGNPPGCQPGSCHICHTADARFLPLAVGSISKQFTSSEYLAKSLKQNITFNQYSY